jgi:hypothetical protein
VDELKYRLTNDLAFKMVFLRQQDKLKNLVALMLSVPINLIKKFTITNPELFPSEIDQNSSVLT